MRLLVLAAMCSLVACGNDHATLPAASRHAQGLAQLPEDPGENPPSPEPPSDPTPPVTPPAPPVVIDGQPCNVPSTVYLTFDGHKCSGVLIRPDLVLTAAHCVEAASSASAISAGVGSTMCLNGSARAVAKAQDPLFRSDASTVNHDLGLVKLSAPVIGAQVAAIDSVPQAGDAITISGFGLDGFEAPQSNLQRCADTAVSNTDNGQIVLNRRNGACHGDSGGPMYRAGTAVVVGIMTNVEEDHTCQGETYGSPIDSGWILSAIAEMEAAEIPCAAGATQRC